MTQHWDLSNLWQKHWKFLCYVCCAGARVRWVYCCCWCGCGRADKRANSSRECRKRCLTRNVIRVLCQCFMRPDIRANKIRNQINVVFSSDRLFVLLEPGQARPSTGEVSTGVSAKNSVTCGENSFFLLLLRNLFIHLGDKQQDILIAFNARC